MGKPRKQLISVPKKSISRLNIVHSHFVWGKVWLLQSISILQKGVQRPVRHVRVRIAAKTEDLPEQDSERPSASQRVDMLVKSYVLVSVKGIEIAKLTRPPTPQWTCQRSRLQALSISRVSPATLQKLFLQSSNVVGEIGSDGIEVNSKKPLPSENTSI